MGKTCLTIAIVSMTLTAAAADAFAQAAPGGTPRPRRNTILFVADGMRPSAVNPTDAPNMARARAQGVSFTNSHSIYPPLTMPNASVIATGHLLGDTGQFANSLYVGFPAASGSMAYGTHDNDALQYLCDHFENKNYITETSLLAAARAAGFHTAAIGKHGPALLQDVTQFNRGVRPITVVLDDDTGSPDSMAVPEKVLALAAAAGVERVRTPATAIPNQRQQNFLLNMTVKAVLPAFLQEPEKPFVLVYWARDPDHSQHNQVDNRRERRFDTLGEGINGKSSKAAIKNTDDNFGALLEYLAATDDPRNPGQKLAANTNVLVTSDHGFGTISRREVDAAGTLPGNFASTIHYQHVVTVNGRSFVTEAELPGFLPPGFVAIDLAEHLKLPLYDVNTISNREAPLTQPAGGGQPRDGTLQYAIVDPKQPPEGTTRRMYPTGGNAVLGGTGKVAFRLSADGKREGGFDPEARLLVVANGGSDTFYFPNARIENGRASPADVALAREVVNFLATQKYCAALFVDTDVYGTMPGALSLRDIGFKGSAQFQPPAIIMSFTTFSMDPANPLYTGVEVTDGGLRHGQGMHGTFARFDTFNNMMAIGPDFKKEFNATDPVSNADIAPTLAHLLGLDLGGTGKLTGRVLEEALAGGRSPVGPARQLLAAPEGPNGFKTEMRVQVLKDSAGREYRYNSWAGTKGRVVTGE